MKDIDILYETTEVKKKTEGWKKIFVILTALIILGLDCVCFVIFLRESMCEKNKDPYATEEVRIVEIEGQWQILPPEEEPVGEKMIKALPDCLLGTIIVMAIPDLVLFLLAVCIYKLIKRKKAGERPWPPIIAGAVILSSSALFLFLAIVGYIKHVEEASKKVPEVRAHAPVIYIYSEETQSVNVDLELDGYLTFTFPEYPSDGGWNVTADSEGNLIDDNGREYDFLFWEAVVYFEPDFSHGACVTGNDTEKYLYEACETLGLNEEETAAFIEYWLPQMEKNDYNVICFQTDRFDDAARLNIEPSPDVLLRVNMVWYPTKKFVDIEEQDLKGMGISQEQRHGLTVVEWGGERIDR